MSGLVRGGLPSGVFVCVCVCVCVWSGECLVWSQGVSGQSQSLYTSDVQLVVCSSSLFEYSFFISKPISKLECPPLP